MVVKKPTMREVAEELVAPAYTDRMDLAAMPKYRLPDDGAPPDVAERLIHDELMLDGNARLNLATFVTTWMDPQAAKLMAESLRQEHDRQGRIPATAEIERRCVERSWPTSATRPRRRCHRRSTDRLLGGRRDARRPGAEVALAAAGARLPAGIGRPKPNLVMGSNVQVVLGEVLPLLGRRTPLRTGGEGPLRHHP